MPDPATIQAGIGVAGALFEGLGSIFGGDPAPQGELFTLPFEMEVEFLNQTNQNLQNINQNIQRIDAAVQAYDRRLAAYSGFLEGQLPAQEVQNTLSSTANEIAGMFGGSAKAAIEAGFLDESSARLSGMIETREGQIFDQIQQTRESQYGSASLDAAFNQQKQQTIQELTRRGASPSQISFALAKLEQDFLLEADQRKLQQIQSLQGTLASSSSALGQAANVNLAGRQQGLNEALSGFQALQGQISQNNQVAAGIAGAAGERFSAANVGIQTQVGLGQAASDQFRSFGALKDSGNLNKQLAAGTLQANAGTASSRQGVGANDPREARLRANVARAEQQAQIKLSQANANTGGSLSPTEKNRILDSAKRERDLLDEYLRTRG